MPPAFEKFFTCLFSTKVNNLFYPFPFTKRKVNDFEYNFTRLGDRNCCNKESAHLSNFLNKTNNIPYLVGKEELGRATWKFLHAISFYYPTQPSKSDEKSMLHLLRLLAKFYPCEDCKIEFESYLTSNPPQLSSQRKFVSWVCSFHNTINQKIGKNMFDCSMLFTL